MYVCRNYEFTCVYMEKKLSPRHEQIFPYLNADLLLYHKLGVTCQLHLFHFSWYKLKIILQLVSIICCNKL